MQSAEWVREPEKSFNIRWLHWIPIDNIKQLVGMPKKSTLFKIGLVKYFSFIHSFFFSVLIHTLRLCLILSLFCVSGFGRTEPVESASVSAFSLIARILNVVKIALFILCTVIAGPPPFARKSRELFCQMQNREHTNFSLHHITVSHFPFLHLQTIPNLHLSLSLTPDVSCFFLSLSPCTTLSPVQK